jgi:2,3-bisphosphoglycerate-dependent phosphoglycerate mutase
VGTAAVGAVGTELVLVRHGQGRCNADGLIGGRRGCTGLSALGRQECVLLAEQLAELDADRRFDAVLTSPRLRVVQCAEIVAARLGRPVAVVDALRGQEFGEADGRSWQHVIERFGGPPAHDPDRPVAPGAESWNAYADRVLAALTGVLETYARGRVLLVVHGRTTGLAGALLSGSPDPRGHEAEFAVGHGRWVRWRREPDGWHLLSTDGRPLPAGPVPA